MNIKVLRGSIVKLLCHSQDGETVQIMTSVHEEETKIIPQKNIKFSHIKYQVLRKKSVKDIFHIRTKNMQSSLCSTFKRN